MEDTIYIILDIGTSTIKCGISGEPFPRIIIPNVLAIKYINSDMIYNEKTKKIYIGNDAFLHSVSSELQYPQRMKPVDSISSICNAIDNDNYPEEIINYVFSILSTKLGVDSFKTSINVFIIDNIFTPLKVRQSIVNAVFNQEKIIVNNIRIEPQELLSAYVSAKPSGLVVESGELSTVVVPVYEGYMINSSVIYNDIAGEAMTKEFLKHNKVEFDYYNIRNQFETARQIKEKYIEICVDGNIPKTEIYESLELPDGNIIKIGNERYTIPEMIFDPLKMGNDSLSVQKMIVDSINKSDLYLKKELYSNIILGGGNCSIKNYSERLKKEIIKEQLKLYSDDSIPPVNIKYNNETKYSAWIGASGICSYKIMQNQWISKAVIDENSDFNNIYGSDDKNKTNQSKLEQKYLFLYK